MTNLLECASSVRDSGNTSSSWFGKNFTFCRLKSTWLCQQIFQPCIN